MSLLGSLIKKPIHTLPKPSDRFVAPAAKVGVEVEVEKYNNKRVGLDLSMWELHTEEHSLRNNGMEFVTTGGKVGEELYDAINNICGAAEKNKWSDGYPRAGIHLHVDCTSLDQGDNQLMKLVSNYALVEHMLFGFAGTWRRSCGYCVPYDIGHADNESLSSIFSLLQKQLPPEKTGVLDNIHGLSKYQALNLQPLRTFGTVEFRHLPTTFDRGRILDWINICLSVYNSASIFDGAYYYGKLCNERGTRDLCATILGKYFHALEKYFSHEAVLNAISFVDCLRPRLTKKSQEYEEKQSSFYLERLASVQAEQKSEKPKKQQTPAQVHVENFFGEVEQEAANRELQLLRAAVDHLHRGENVVLEQREE